MGARLLHRPSQRPPEVRRDVPRQPGELGLRREKLRLSALLQSLGRTLAAGFLLLIALLAAAGTYARLGEPAWWAFVARWLHVLSGLMWVGLLYYFNFVQIPAMARIPEEQKPAVAKVIAPAALFWFRWSAMATVLTGLVLATLWGYLGAALSLQKGYVAIGVGMWLALVMWFNVWFIIWPSQKKALGMVSAPPDEKGRAARRALLTSRFNTMLSIPMLYAMVAQQNGGL